MQTLLDQIIDGATDDSVSTVNLLRKVQIAATRVGADDVSEWTKRELAGYDDETDLPAYRSTITSVTGLFTGPFQSQIKQPLPPHPDFIDQFTIRMRQPLAELQAFASGDDDPQLNWPAWEVKRYEEAGIFGIESYGLFNAWNSIPRQSLMGIIDTIRNKAMEFALALQTQFPEAGTVGGPSLSTEPSLAPVVFNTTNNIYGSGNSVATGSNISQKAKLLGNRDEFLRQVTQLGLSAGDAEEFVEIVASEQSVESERTRGFLSKVRTGAVALGLSISSEVISGSLIEIGKLFLGQ